MNKKESEIDDLYNGDQVSAWKDDTLTYLSIMNVTVAIPNEMWNETKNDLKRL